MKKEWQEEFLEKQNELITAIVQQVSDAIPGRWKNFYLNAEISDNLSGGIYFFFNIEKNKNYIYCEDIPDIYNVYEEEYEERRNNIYKLSQKLKEIFIKHNLNLWQAITIIVDSERKLKMYYDYADWINSSFDPTSRIQYFKYKYLGKTPEDKKQEELFKEMEEYQSKFNK